MTSGIGQRFEAGVDREAWRRPLRPWLAAGAAAVALGPVLWTTGWAPPAAVAALVLLGLAGPVAKVGGYVARRRRRDTPLVLDREGARVPTASGAAFLPWDTLREVVVDGPTLRFRVRAGVTPGTDGVRGMHRRDAWPVASGPGLPVDTRLFTRDRDEILAAVHAFSGGRL